MFALLLKSPLLFFHQRLLFLGVTSLTILNKVQKTHAGDLQDSPNKVGIMTSKSTGEPPLLASVSVLTAFSAALTAARQGLAAMHAQTSTSQPAVSGKHAAGNGQAAPNGEADDSHGSSSDEPQAASNGNSDASHESSSVGKQAASNGKAKGGSNGVSASRHQAIGSSDQMVGKQPGTDDRSVQEQVLYQLQAPVTVKEVKRVLGQLHLPELLLAVED